MTYIYVNAAGGGIANRLNSLLNAIALSKVTNKKVIAFWNNTHFSCECNFDDIFLLQQNDRLEIRKEVLIESNKYLILLDYIEDSYHLSSGAPWNILNFKDLPEHHLIKYLQELPNDCDIVIRTPNLYSFGIPVQQTMRDFHTIAQFQPHFKGFIQQFLTSHTLDIGVHMRMTDKILHNKYNPEVFFSEVQRIKDQFPDRSFFICSDDTEYEEKALSILPNSLHYSKQTKLLKKIENAPLVFQKEGEYFNTFENFIRNKEYSIDGFRDLYLLGCCQQILGINTGGSTYSSYAKLLIESNIRILFES
jgi:hypothetical protein